MQEQASLGRTLSHIKPKYEQTQIGRIVNNADYDKYGKVEVVFLDYSRPFPVWVNGDIDRKPSEGDLVLVGFIQGRADAPYLAGFVRNESYTANYIKVEKGKITLQVPTSEVDKKEHMTNDSRKSTRMRLEIDSSGVYVNGTKIG